jgi:hypothetical protein
MIGEKRREKRVVRKDMRVVRREVLVRRAVREWGC